MMASKTVTMPLMIACSTEPIALTMVIRQEPMARKTLWNWQMSALMLECGDGKWVVDVRKR